MTELGLRVIDEKTILAIEKVISKGDRVELIPVKDGVKVIHIRRKEIKPNTDTQE